MGWEIEKITEVTSARNWSKKDNLKKTTLKRHIKSRGRQYMRKSFQFILMAAVAFAAFAATPVKTFATVDLAIESARVDPPQGNPSTVFSFAVTIKNRGTTQAKVQPGCFKYRLSTDASSSYKDVKNPTPNPYILNPGQTVECKGQPMSNLPAGLISIDFLVENNLADKDTDSQNNHYYLQVPVANPATGYVGLPELYFSQNPSFSAGKNAAGIGEDVSVYVYVGNRGDADAMVPKGAVLWNVTENGKVLAEDKRFDQNTIIKTGSKDNWRWAKLPNLVPGMHNLVINMDPQNVVKEKNETHQPAFITLNISVPDLFVTLQSLAGKSYATTESIPLLISVRNRGFVAASFPLGSHFLYYGAKGFAVNKVILDAPLQVGPSGEYRIIYTLPPFTTTPGTYDVEVWVDPVNTMHDPNLADNKTSSKVTLVATSLKGSATTNGPIAPKTPINTVPSGAVPRIVPPREAPRPVPSPGLGR